MAERRGEKNNWLRLARDKGGRGPTSNYSSMCKISQKQKEDPTERTRSRGCGIAESSLQKGMERGLKHSLSADSIINLKGKGKNPAFHRERRKGKSTLRENSKSHSQGSSKNSGLLLHIEKGEKRSPPLFEGGGKEEVRM